MRFRDTFAPMRAIVFDQFGDESVLHIGDAEAPALAASDLRIRVAGTAVNRADLLQRQGHYPPPPGASLVLGLECAGTVAEMGSEVSGWRVGERAMALLPGGGYAEEVVVDARSAIHVPDSLGDDEAAALPEVFLTAFLNIFDLARARRGETVLVHGGGSGVGTAATTLGKLAGLRVFVTVGSAEKAERCREHGADVAINYRNEDFVARAMEETDGRGVDMVLDHIGASYVSRDLQALATGGRIVVIGSMGGPGTIELNVGSLLAKRQQIIGSTLRARPVAEKGAIVAGFLDKFGDALRDGRLRPVIDRVYPLEQASEAHRRMSAGENFGKIVLRVSPSAG